MQGRRAGAFEQAVFHLYAVCCGLARSVTAGGGDGKARYRGYARQGLAPEAVREDALKVFQTLYLAGGMAGNGQLQIRRGNTAAVVLNADTTLPAVFKADINLAGLGIQTVFHQFFQHAGGPFNHLASGDLVAQLRRQQAYMTIFFRHGSSVCARVWHGKRRRRA